MISAQIDLKSESAFKSKVERHVVRKPAPPLCIPLSGPRRGSGAMAAGQASILNEFGFFAVA
jgi:hypothetical protein